MGHWVETQEEAEAEAKKMDAKMAKPEQAEQEEAAEQGEQTFVAEQVPVEVKKLLVAEPSITPEGTIVNWEQLEHWGLVEEINNQLMHNLGLKLRMENGQCVGALISPSMIWEPNKAIPNPLLQDFLAHRGSILESVLQNTKL